MAPGRARRIVIGSLLAAAVLAAAGWAVPAVVPPRPVVVDAPAAPVAPPAPEPDVFDTGAKVTRQGEPGLWLSWSLQERSTGRRTGSANAATDRTNSESAIKAWIAADHLRVADAAGRAVTARERDLIRRAVRSSDDDAAETLYRGLGGDAVLGHLGDVCDVRVATDRRGYWALTQITAVDATRMLDCVLRLAPRWAGGNELVGDLRAVDEAGRSGIATLVGGATVAEKNGWTYHSSTGWNVNCVVAWDDYVMSVLTRFSGDRPEQYGWQVCRDVARDVLSGLPKA